MANHTLQSLLRDPKVRNTDRVTFAQAVARISYIRSQREVDARKHPKHRQSQA